MGRVALVRGYCNCVLRTVFSTTAAADFDLGNRSDRVERKLVVREYSQCLKSFAVNVMIPILGKSWCTGTFTTSRSGFVNFPGDFYEFRTKIVIQG